MDWDKVKLFLGVLTAGAAGLWATVPVMSQILLVLMVLDIVSGLIASYITRAIDSEIGTRGLARKGMIWVMIAAGAAAKPLIADVPVPEAIAGFYCLMELISILENAGGAGVPVPRWLGQAMAKLREQFDAGAV